MEFLRAWVLPPEYSGDPWLYMSIAAAALLLTSVSKGGFGGGVGLLSVPLMLQVAPYPFVIGLWLPILIACDLATIHHYPQEWNVRAFLRLAPGTLLGIAAATILLSRIDLQAPPAEFRRQEAWLKLGVAGIALLFVVLQLKPKSKDRDAPWRPGWPVSLGIGVAAGITTMLAHAAGSIVTMFFLPMQMEKRVFVGTTGRYFFTFNSLKIPFYVAIGWMTWTTLSCGIWLMLLGPLGVWLGSWLNARLKPAWFVRLIYLFLLLAAVKLIFDGWRTLASG